MAAYSMKPSWLLTSVEPARRVKRPKMKADKPRKNAMATVRRILLFVLRVL